MSFIASIRMAARRILTPQSDDAPEEDWEPPGLLVTEEVCRRRGAVFAATLPHTKTTRGRLLGRSVSAGRVYKSRSHGHRPGGHYISGII